MKSTFKNTKKTRSKALRSSEKGSGAVSLSKGERAAQRSFWRKFGPLLSETADLKAPPPVIMLLMAAAPAIPKSSYSGIETRVKALMEYHEQCKEPQTASRSTTGSNARPATRETSTTGRRKKTTAAGDAGRTSKPTAIGNVLGSLMTDLAKSAGRKAPAKNAPANGNGKN